MRKKHTLKLKKILLILLLPVLSAPFALLGNMLPVSAASGTYSTLGIDGQIKAYEYYVLLTTNTNANTCKPNGTIQNSDITNYKFFWAYIPRLYTGSAVKLTNDFNCTSESAIKTALQVVGINAKDPGEILCQLGYTQTEAKSTTVTSCGKNANKQSANDTFKLLGTASKEASYQKALLKNSTVFAGTAPTWTDAMKYKSTLNDFEQLCKAADTSGTTYNITNPAPIAVVGTDGITTQTWSYTSHPIDQVNYFYLNIGGSVDGSQSCAGIAANLKSPTSKYILAYQQYAYEAACIQANHNNTSDSVFISACVQGAKNPTNYVLCSKLPTSQYVGGTVQYSDARNACFLGQGLPVDASGTTAGELCMKLGTSYQTDPKLTACINGAINKGTPTYCATTYYTGYYGGTFEDHSVELAACLSGSALDVSNGTGALVPTIHNIVPPSGSVNATSCVLDGIGWMVCPLITAVGKLDDAMYGFVEGVLVLNPLQQNDSSGKATPIYQNWSAIRNIANVLLVIGFLIIIFSQISSVGISNYGVKKMLPRVILVAIAINLSWILMSLAVDVVNVIGVGLNTLLSSLAVNAPISASKVAQALVTGATSVTVGGVVLYFALPALGIGLGTLVLMALPFLLGAALALLAAVVTLFLRNAIVVILVIISPVAIAASILPNTEQYFKSWRKLLMSMLLLFPMAELLFAGSKFAAYVVLISGQEMGVVAALFIMAAPLGMLPWLARSSGGILSTVNKKLGGMAKSAQGAAQKGLARRVATSKSEYGSGSRNFFGRKRTNQWRKDEHGNVTGKRTRAQKWSNRGEALDTRAANANKQKKSHFEDSGLVTRQDETIGTPRQQRRAAKANLKVDRITAIVDEGRSQGLREKAIGAQYQARLETRQIAPHTEDNLNTERLEDAEATSGRSKAILKQRQDERIRGGATNTVASVVAPGDPTLLNLRDVNRAAYVAEAGSTAAIAQTVEANEDSGAADIYIQHEKEAKFGSEVNAEQQNAVFANEKNSRQDLVDLANEQDVAKQSREAAEHELAATVEETAELGLDTREEDKHRKEGAEERKAVIHSADEAKLAARRSPTGGIDPVTGLLNGQEGDLYNLTREQEESKLQKEGAEAAQKAAFDRRQTPDGDLADLKDAIDTSTVDSELAKTQQDAALQRRKASGDLVGLTAEEVRAKLDAENAQNQQKSTAEDSKLPGGENSDLFAESIIGKVASDRTAAEQKRIENEARFGVNQQNPDGSGPLFTQELDAEGNLVGGQLANIRDADQDTQASTAAANWAEGGKAVNYSKEIDDETERGKKLVVKASGAAVKKADGTQKRNADGAEKVDPLAEAKAAKVVLEDKQSDRQNIVSKAQSRKMKNDEALAEIGVDIYGNVTDEDAFARLTSAQAVGYIQYASERGDRQTGMALVSTASHMLGQAQTVRQKLEEKRRRGEPISNNEEEEVVRRETDAKDAQALLAKSDSLPPWIGGSDRQKLAEGRFTLTNEETAIAAVAGGKLTAKTFANMDINNRVAFVKALETMDTKDVIRLKKNAATTMADDAGLLKKSPDGKNILKDSNGNPLGLDGNPFDLTQHLEQVDTNFAQTVIAINKAQNDHRMNSELATRDIAQYDKSREKLQQLANGKIPKPDPMDPATHSPSSIAPPEDTN